MNAHLAARDALALTSIDDKPAAAVRLWAAWQGGALTCAPVAEAPLDQPGRPARPVLAAPADMPRRQLNGPRNHAALIHALAHIEFNAIDLALDAVQRFTAMPEEFHGDWLRVAAEEAHHFRLLRDHLRTLGHDYGDFPAHDGLWQMAAATADDALARMALVPRLLEARGLDVTPGLRRKLAGYGDHAGAAILDGILRDEIGHVAIGDRWFRHLCAQRDLPVEASFRALLARPGVPAPRGPFNETARRAAGFSHAELRALARDYADKRLDKSSCSTRPAQA